MPANSRWDLIRDLKGYHGMNNAENHTFDDTCLVNLTFVRLCIVIYFYSKTNDKHRFLKFILFCSSTLHVSDGFSVHHHESTTK